LSGPAFSSLGWIDKPVKGLIHLRKLYLTGTKVSDLEPIEGLTELQNLFIGSTQIYDIEPLSSLASLGLKIYYNPITTGRLNISQFFKNSDFISPLISAT
jgi:Leucine-rich repeat (LRR) protein